MAKGKKDGEFEALAKKSQNDVVGFNEAVRAGLVHGASPQFTYTGSFKGRKNNPQKTFNLISDPVVIPWRLKEDDSSDDDVIYLSGHLNATLTFGYLTKSTSLSLKVAKMHLTVRRQRAQQAIDVGEAQGSDTTVAAVHIGGASSSGWKKRPADFANLLNEIRLESTLPEKTTLITSETLEKRLDEWISIKQYNDTVKGQFRRELKSNVEKVINEKRDPKVKYIMVSMDEVDDYD
jgi:hypothetical protein